MVKHRQRVAAMGQLGERIRQLCAARGLSIPEVERRAGLCRNQLRPIVSGRNKKPYGRTLVRIARVLGVGLLTADRARLDGCGELRP